MQNIYSMTGASANTEMNWVWCIPGKTSTYQMPICVLVMSSAGPRYLPTQVIAHTRYRNHTAQYVEVQPTTHDMYLMEAVLGWELRRHGSKPTSAEICECTKIANNVAAAMRFLDRTGNACNAELTPIREDDLYWGRSVLVCISRSQPFVRGWVASAEEPFVVVFQDTEGEFRKIAADFDCLFEDGSAEVP